MCRLRIYNGHCILFLSLKFYITGQSIHQNVLGIKLRLFSLEIFHTIMILNANLFEETSNEIKLMNSLFGGIIVD